MVFNATDITAILVATAALVTAIGTAIASIIAARTVARKVDSVAVAVAEVGSDTKVVAGHVNSAATAAAGKIAGLQQELVTMREIMADKKETAALLAQAAVRPDPARAGSESGTV